MDLKPPTLEETWCSGTVMLGCMHVAVYVAGDDPEKDSAFERLRTIIVAYQFAGVGGTQVCEAEHPARMPFGDSATSGPNGQHPDVRGQTCQLDSFRMNTWTHGLESHSPAGF
ncbi:hypothetical protein CI102_12355 [Trichoderma harzianum]|nr:hypothetical protein CI102_12355 [Trichoderma harzianum]